MVSQVVGPLLADDELCANVVLLMGELAQVFQLHPSSNL